jgi:O-antigen/teichoic acid export membrane protein
MIKEKLREIFGHSALYSLSYICGSAAGIILLPVYTRYLSKADYGLLEILAYTNAILHLIMAAGVNTALAKFYQDAKGLSEQKIVISTATVFVFFSALTGSLLCYWGDCTLARIILGDAAYAPYVDINILVLLSELTVGITSMYFIVTKRPRIFVMYNLLRLVLGITGNLYFLIVMGFGARGILYGQLISNGIAAVLLAWHVIRKNGVHFDVVLLKRILSFSYPIVPAMLGATIMHNADRFLIRYYGSLADVGIYSLGYKLPFMLNTIILASFARIWTGSMMYEVAREPDSKFQYARITTYFMAVCVFVMFALSVFSVNVVRILAAPKFFAAHQVVPIVALGLCFHAFYTFFTVGAYLESKTWLLNISYLPAAFVNVAANMILLPKYGYLAAAWVTVLTYAVFALAAYFSCKKALYVPYEFRRLFQLFAGAVVIYFLSSLMPYEGILLDFVKGCLAIVLFLATLILGRWLSEGEKQVLKARYLTIRSKLVSS